MIIVQRQAQRITNTTKLDAGKTNKFQRDRTVLGESIRKRYVDETPDDHKRQKELQPNESSNVRFDSKSRKPIPTPRISKLKSGTHSRDEGTSDSDSDTEVYSAHVDICLPKQEQVESSTPSIEDIRLCTELLQTSLNNKDKHGVHECIYTLIDYGVHVQLEAEPTTKLDSEMFRYLCRLIFI